MILLTILSLSLSLSQCLPITIDVGTNTESIRNDPYYIGLRQPRERGQPYDQLLEEFFNAAKEVFGRTVLLQVSDMPRVLY